MNLKDRMRAAIKHRECSIPELAEAAGVKVPSAHGWVNGDSKSLKAGPAIKAAAFLGVDALWLAEGEGQMIVGSSRLKPVTTQVIKLSEQPISQAHARKMVQDVCDVAERIDDTGLRNLLDVAKCLAKNHPLTKAKPQSSA